MKSVQPHLRRAARSVYLGDFAAAKRALLQALALVQRGQANDELEATLLNKLGIVNKYAGAYIEASQCYRRAFALVRRLGLKGTSLHADLLHNRGGLAHAQHRFAQAEAWARQGVALRQALVKNSNDPELLADLVALAAILHERRHYRAAATLYQKVLRRYEAPAIRHATLQERVVAWNNLAATQVALGQRRVAQELYGKALRLKRQILGPDHPDLATTLNNLALLHDDLGEARRAKLRLRQALAILQRSVGTSHPNYAVVHANYCKLARNLASTSAR